MGSANRGRIEEWQADGNCRGRASFLRAAQCDCIAAKARLPDRAAVIVAQAILPATDSMHRSAAGVADRIVCFTRAVSLIWLRCGCQFNGTTLKRSNSD